MSDFQDNEANRQKPVIDHAPVSGPVPPPQHSAPAEAPPPRRGGTPFLITLLFTAALGGGIYWTWTHPHDVPPPPIDPAPAIDAAKSEIEQQIDQISGRLTKLEQAPAPKPAPADTGAVADLGKRLDELAGHLNDLGQQQAQLSAALQKLQETAGAAPGPAAAPGAPSDQSGAGAGAQQQIAELAQKLDAALTQEKTSLDTLTDRLGKLEQARQADTASDTAKQAAATADANKQALDTLETRVKTLEQSAGQIAGAKQDAVLAVKLTAAQAALESGQPLGDLPGAPPALARFAKTAPPTQADLKAQFPAFAKAALVASRPEELKHSFLGQALARLEQSITVRRGDHVIVGDPAAGILDKAQQSLDADDLKGAVQALGALSGPAAQAVQPWLAQANAVLAARSALASLAHS
jgi:hypothetical protein